MSAQPVEDLVLPDTVMPVALWVVPALDPDPEPAPDRNWRDDALCAQTDPEAFFPDKGGSTHDAKRICRACDVRAECLDFAITNGERFGIWGGLSERQRRRLEEKAG